MTRHYIPYLKNNVMYFKEIHILPDFMQNGENTLFETSYEETKNKLNELLNDNKGENLRIV